MKMMLFNIEHAKTRTAALRLMLAETDAPPQLSEKDLAIQRAVNNGRWGCQDESVRALVKAITGVDCPKGSEQKKRPLVEGAVVMFGDHPALITGFDGDSDPRYIRNYVEYGSFTTGYISAGEDWTPATDEQVDQFFGVKVTEINDTAE